MGCNIPNANSGSPPVTRSIPLDLLNETMQRLKNPAYKPTKPGSPPYFYRLSPRGRSSEAQALGPNKRRVPYWTTSWHRFGAREWFDLACVVSSAMPIAGLHFLGHGRRGSVMSKVVGNQRIDVAQVLCRWIAGDNLDRSDEDLCDQHHCGLTMAAIASGVHGQSPTAVFQPVNLLLILCRLRAFRAEAQ